MSEFRKQRLLAKLFDSVSLQLNPYEYSMYLSANETRTFEVTDGQINDLAQTSTNPERFRALAQVMAGKNSHEVGTLLHLLKRLRDLEKSTSSITNKFTNPASCTNFSLPPIVVPEKIHNSVHEVDDELDEISRKLKHINSKITGLETSQNFEALGTAKIQLRFFKNTFETALGSRPTEIREFALVEDLLFVLLGFPGSFISAENGDFGIDDSIDPALIPILAPILELSSNIQLLHQFAASTRSNVVGRTLQSFGAVIDAICLEYNQLVSALEKRFNLGGFLLGQLSLYLRPFIEKASVLYEIVSSISSKKLQGGALLNFLEVQMAMNAGNLAYKSTLERILIPTAEPFLVCLSTWLKEGRLDENLQDEFMIGYNPSSDSELDAFELKPDRIPCVFTGIAQKILLIGIYQNILRKAKMELATTAVFPMASEFIYNQNSLTRMVGNLFSAINKSMVQVLESENHIHSLFYRLKHLFFIDQVDSFSNFIQLSLTELNKNAKDVDLAWLERKLEDSNVIRESEEEGIHCKMATQSVFDQLLGIIGGPSRPSELPKEATLKGIDALLLDVKVEFPANLVISRDSVAKYQIIFRFLSSVLILNSRLSAKKRFNKLPGNVQKLLAIVKHSMIQFVINLQSYLAYQVLQPQFKILVKNMSNVTGLDRIISLHTNYLDTCLRECLLTNSKLVQLLASIFASCERFCTILEALDSCAVSNLPGENEILAQLNQLQQHFSKCLRIFLEALQYYSARDSDHYLGNLLTQLDFNSFYYSSVFARQGNDSHPIGGMVVSEQQ